MVTSAAAMLVIDPKATIACLAVFLLIVLVSRIVSLASISVALLYPFATYYVYSSNNDPRALSVALCASVFAALVIYMHRSNIVRLLKGEENRFGKKKGK